MFSQMTLRWAVLYCVCLGLASSVCGDEGEAPPKEPAQAEAPRFIRITRDEQSNQLESLDTAITRYRLTREGKPAVIVDLVGAVHVGEKSYYEQLNETFKQYDVLLYELVAPKGTRVPADGRREGTSPVGALQLMMKDVLRLDYQLDGIDYQAENFVHADMSPEEFGASMKRLDETPMKMFFQLMKASAQQQAERKPQVTDAVLLAALFDRKNGSTVLKRAMALELSGSDVMLEALNGPNGSTIVTERNKVALQVMLDEIEKGKTRIGIFYGAAHLKDMHERLLGEHGFEFRPRRTRWLKAWDLHVDLPEKPKTEDAPAKAE